MALKTKTVKLSGAVTAFGKSYSELVLREPSGAVYFDLGPLQTSYRAGEIESTHEMPGVFIDYLERCTTNVDDPGVAMRVILADLCLEDAVRLRRVFNSFFNEAVEKVLASEKKPPEAAAAA